MTDSSLPTATQALVKIRTSQINGCASCTDMHTKDAEHAGGSPARFKLVAVWQPEDPVRQAMAAIPPAS